LYWVGTTVYNQYIASEYNVKLPFIDENDKALYITNINSARDPTFDQLLAFLQEDATDTYVSQHPYYVLAIASCGCTTTPRKPASAATWPS
jgi:hypothetical protein